MKKNHNLKKKIEKVKYETAQEFGLMHRQETMGKDSNKINFLKRIKKLLIAKNRNTSSKGGEV
ncbi:MAG: hypothetical protein PHX01_04735 [Clostridia bacterium]|jgi:hypothetical protein|nr:hypothetical protein [Clostridia bacterium]